MKIKSKKIIKLITHDGSFHSDDIFACATLSLLLEAKNENFEIIRTRDEEMIEKGDYVFDVGNIYDERNNRFDHHQKGGAGKRENEIEYASFGLIWKRFGMEFCGSQKAFDIIEKKLVSPIDAHDNGFDLVNNIYEVSPYSIQHFFYSMNPTWREENVTDDEMFIKSVQIAKDILTREIIQAQDVVLAEEKVIMTYKETQDKRIIILDKHYPYENVLQNYSEPLLVICPSRNIKNKWTVKALREDLKTFKNRINFPKSWAGLKTEELQRITGVSDAVFCHKNLFLAVAKSKEGAIKLAELALLV